MSLFKRFNFKVIIRVSFILVTVLLLAYIFGDDRLFFNQIILFILLVLQVYELIRFVNYTNRELAKFILSIRHNDFSINFRRSKIGRSFEELHDAFDDIIQSYEEAKIEKQAQFEYLRLVVNNMNIGIISLENNQNIALMNKSAERILGVKGIKNWRILEEKSRSFTAKINEMNESGRRLIEISIQGQSHTLSVDVVLIKMLDTQYKLITFQDIHGEIEQKEIEAWHKLIKILTHEIMNSATPISSLTETMQSVIEADGKAKKVTELDDETIEDLLFSLKTIQRRSNGMLTFIDDYRRLTKVAKPKLEKVNMQQFLDSISSLLQAQLKKDKIGFEYSVDGMDELMLDSALIEQVLINMVKNATYALQNTKDPKIVVKGYVENNKKTIEITDNGAGIPDKEISEIFVPFFSTKKDGSGIGLSLSKQIMHLHNGNIRVKSEVGKGTSFYLVFNG
ncbi:MAG: ATP-binding protein [Fulvivirga sp.]|uniref:sensor histidine kinase n=1 Tax=Fulvivirga sp. TaxID=1931237 RepID=UPI0032EBDA3D